MRRAAQIRSPEPNRRVRVREALGQGGLGTVFRAEIQESQGPAVVALKTLHLSVGRDPRHQAQLLQEARLLGALRHRAIVRVHDLVEAEDRWLLLLEHIDGCDLRRLLRAQGPAPVAATLVVVAELASALDGCWRQAGPDGAPLRLVHGDLKPSNVMLTASGEVKLLDFGLAGIGQRATGGSVAYQPPPPRARAGHADDVFALGALCVELLLGTPLGPLEDEDALAARLAELLPRVEARAEGAGEALVTLLLGALAPEASARPDARTVERLCRDLLERAPGPGLRAWAAEVVPPLRADPVEPSLDPLCGASFPLPARQDWARDS